MERGKTEQSEVGKLVILFSYRGKSVLEEYTKNWIMQISGADADRGNTRTHPEHEG